MKENNMNLLNYAESLRKELDDFVGEQGVYHEITMHKSDSLIVCEIHFRKSKTSFKPVIKELNQKTSHIFKKIESSAKEKRSQWFYAKKALKIYGKNRIYLCKEPHVIDWTETQAMIDGYEIIAGMISGIHLTNKTTIKEGTQHERNITSIFWSVHSRITRTGCRIT